MASPPFNPVGDPRVEHRHSQVNGYNYHYLYAEPANGKFEATVFLIHGWPDCSAGWRYQIPLLLDMGLRVVAPDLMGFGGTDAPKVPPNDISLYGFKRASDDIAELAKIVGSRQIILGGHDWGGAVVWRAALWHPDLISHVFSVCTPYSAPSKQYISTEDLARGPLPQFGYQIQLASGEVEKFIKDEPSIRQFLKGIYGAKGANGEHLMIPEQGIIPETLPLVGDSRLLNGKMLDYYVQEYSRHGIHSTLNWYRSRKVNWEQELELVKQNKKTISIPTLFVQANFDSYLKPEMSKSMGAFMPNLTRGDVDATHWILMQKPAEANLIIKNWLQGQGFGLKTRSSL
ncbi:unnamed protein product [Periconia digitata]|uniref:AB hydrolase-1 domain-containing protein n=1 Tax=Periconia digitata TaxID=1303443 RepID=A0A9W4UL60_9PLEO|nr:unnamed protein product [Periconia digitata]